MAVISLIGVKIWQVFEVVKYKLGKPQFREPRMKVFHLFVFYLNICFASILLIPNISSRSEDLFSLGCCIFVFKLIAFVCTKKKSPTDFATLRHVVKTAISIIGNSGQAVWKGSSPFMSMCRHKKTCFIVLSFNDITMWGASNIVITAITILPKNRKLLACDSSLTEIWTTSFQPEIAQCVDLENRYFFTNRLFILFCHDNNTMKYLLASIWWLTSKETYRNVRGEIMNHIESHSLP